MRLFVYMLISIVSISTMAKDTPANLVISAQQSKISWVGKKITGAQHNGIAQVQSGTVTVAGDLVTGGTITMDMNSIANLDVTDKGQQEYLVKHLKSNDFFDTANHPTATYAITKVEPLGGNNYNITGNLTIRGKTFPETIKATITKNGDKMQAAGNLKFDRLKYGVSYNSEAQFLKKLIKVAKDKVIADTVELNFELVAMPN